VSLTHTRWPIFVALIAGGAFVAILWYLVLANPSGEAVPASGGRYVEGVVRAPERVNPLFAHTNPIDRDLASLIFSGLVRLGPDGTPQPDLAERWEITGNGQRYVFHLRRGVAWQDEEQTAFDADDVVFTFRAISDPAFKGDPALAQLMQGVVVSARDPYTVEFRLEQAYAPFLAYMNVGILPEHLLRGLDANQLYNDEFNVRPVGTGRYRLVGRSNDTVVLEANETYYLGPPLISRLEFRVFAEAEALLGALRQQEIDGALLPPSTTAEQMSIVEDTGAFQLHPLTSTSTQMLFFDTRLPQFNDVAIRQALWQGLNVDTLIREVAGGRGALTEAGIPQASWAYMPGSVPSFDAGRAARTLERAGWSLGSDGIRRKADVRLSFELSTSNEPLRVAIAENIARQWQSIGVEARVLPIDASAYIGEHLLQRQFEAALVEVDPGPDPDPYPFWHSSQAAPPGRNLSNYANPVVDDALERGRQTTDVERRRDLIELFQGYFIADAPAIPLYHPTYTYAQSTRAQGFEPSLLFTQSARFASVSGWYVETRVE